MLQPIAKPTRDEWGTGLDAMQEALALEKKVNEALLNLHKVSDKHVDPEVCVLSVSDSAPSLSCTCRIACRIV